MSVLRDHWRLFSVIAGAASLVGFGMAMATDIVITNGATEEERVAQLQRQVTELESQLNSADDELAEKDELISSLQARLAASGSEAGPATTQAPSDSGSTQASPGTGQRTRELELAINRSWDVDNWEEPTDSDTWDFKLGPRAISFREFAEADSDWTLADCEDPELRAWDDVNRWIDVSTENDMFCLRTTTGGTALLEVIKMPSNDQLVETFVVEVTYRA